MVVIAVVVLLAVKLVCVGDAMAEMVVMVVRVGSGDAGGYWRGDANGDVSGIAASGDVNWWVREG